MSSHYLLSMVKLETRNKNQLTAEGGCDRGPQSESQKLLKHFRFSNLFVDEKIRRDPSESKSGCQIRAKQCPVRPI